LSSITDCGSGSSSTVLIGEPENLVGKLTANKLRANLPQVICSTAINPANLEYLALDLGCPIFHRSDLLAALIQNYYSIAVAGTHAKQQLVV